MGDTTKNLVQPRNPLHECVFCVTPHAYGNSIPPDAVCVTCKSPLALAEPRRFEQSDQRAVSRISSKLDVRFFTEWPQAQPHLGMTGDVSLNGMRRLQPRLMLLLDKDKQPLPEFVELDLKERAEAGDHSITIKRGLPPSSYDLDTDNLFL